MNSREQTLALILVGAIAATVAGAVGYFFVWVPLGKQRTEENALNQEIADLQNQSDAQKKTAAKIALARVRSLPADETLARREYTVALERMSEAAGILAGHYNINPKSIDNSTRAVPELTKGKPIYTRVAFQVVLKKVNMTMVKEFLQRYHQFGLLHQITAITIKKEDDPNLKGRREDLTVDLTTEAIIVEGADNRKTLLPVPAGFAAIGGGGLFLGVTLNPEAARGVSPQLQTPVLAVPHRDYDLIVRKDPFNGPLPVIPDEPFKLDKISDVKVRPDKAHDPIKVPLKGDGSEGAKVTALASGSLFAEGALKVDPKTNAITLPETSATEGTSTINVIATSADGSKTEKTSFKVSIEEPPPGPKGPEKDDVSFAIILIGTTPRSDGTAWARIFDNANRLRYTIEATAKGVEVRKEWYTKEWKKDIDYDHPPGVLVISDDETRTHRTFKVIAVDADGLIVADLKPNGSAPDKPKGPPPKGGKGPTKQGHASALSALGGNMIVAVPQPKFYRWGVGQSLASLKTPLSDEEVHKIQKAVSATGPVSDVAFLP
jgi:hypothetical protein